MIIIPFCVEFYAVHYSILLLKFPFKAGIDLVSMMNVIKLDDASSIADSALATSTATFTVVSQYSEVRQ